MSNESVIVTGLGRCGTSLVMQMLAAGGYPVIGQYPAFEDPRFAPSVGHVDPPPGFAVKVLDAHRMSFARCDYRWIVLTRNEDEQARSQLKLLRTYGLPVDRKMRKVVAKSLRAELPKLFGKAGYVGGPIMRLGFEYILANPAQAARKLAKFVGQPLSCDAMAAQVRHRSPKCLPEMLEFELLGVE